MPGVTYKFSYTQFASYQWLYLRRLYHTLKFQVPWFTYANFLTQLHFPLCVPHYKVRYPDSRHRCLSYVSGSSKVHSPNCHLIWAEMIIDYSRHCRAAEYICLPTLTNNGTAASYQTLENRTIKPTWDIFGSVPKRVWKRLVPELPSIFEPESAELTIILAD